MNQKPRSPFQKGKVISERPRVGTIRHKDLDNTCWLVQFWGIEYCRSCSSRNTEDCGGSREVKEYLSMEMIGMKTFQGPTEAHIGYKLPECEEIEDLIHIRDEIQSFQTSGTFIGACLYEAQKRIEEAIAYLKREGDSDW